MKIKKTGLITVLSIAAIIIACDVFFLVNNGFFWDDWCWIDNNFPASHRSVGGLVVFEFGSLFHYKFNSSPIAAKFFLCIADIIGTCFLYFSLKFFKFISKWAFLIALLSSLVPIHYARYSLSCFGYYICLCYFYIASFFYLKYLHVLYRGLFFKKILFGLISLFFFLKSFSTQSCLAYYIVPIVFGYVYLYGLEGLKLWKRDSFKSVLLYVRGGFVFLLIPFLFFYISSHYYPATGVYAAELYNVPRKNYVFTSFAGFVDVFSNAFLHMEMLVWRVFQRIFLVLPFFFIFFLFFLIVCIRHFYKNEEKRGGGYEISFGITDVVAAFLFIGFFATFAYSCVGKYGRIISWESRHLLLCGLSFALLFFIIALVCSCTKKGIKTRNVAVVMYAFVFVFFVDRLYTGYKMYIENLKQEFLIAKFKESKDVKNKEILFINWDSDFFLCKVPPFYEFTGYCWRAYGTRDHLIFGNYNNEDLDFILSIKNTNDFKISDVKRNKVQATINFTFVPNPIQTLECLYLQFFKRSEFNAYLSTLGTFCVVPAYLQNVPLFILKRNNLIQGV